MRFLERFWFGCGHCHDGHGCPVANGGECDQNADCTAGYTGWRLAAVVAVVFLLPLVSGIAGAQLAGRWCTNLEQPAGGFWQLVGLLGGFATGVLTARVLVSWMRRLWPLSEQGVS